MGFSPLANMSRRIPQLSRYNYRNSSISGFTIHHNAGVDSYSEATNPNREVSANYWITNDGAILPHVDENYRAWTTGATSYPAGAQSDHRNITVEVSNSPEGVRNGTWAISTAAYSALVALIADVFKRHNLGSVRRGTHGGVAVHQDFVPTACPGPYIMSHLGSIIAQAESVRNGGSASPAPNPGTGGGGASGSIAQLAQEVLAGKHGNGADRQRSLGSKYAAVQAEVNRLLGIGNPQPKPAANIDALAQAVLRGDYGNGADRQRALGSNYQAVQNEVNRRLYGGGGGSSGGGGGAAGNIAALADAVQRGEYGNGAERQRRLGSNYAAVQAEVNRRLGIGGGSSGGGKSVAQLAQEVLAGKHGNGAARQRSLGSQYQAVQNEVNRLLGIR